MTKEQIIQTILDYQKEIDLELKQTIEAFGHDDRAVERLVIRSVTIGNLVDNLNLEQ